MPCCFDWELLIWLMSLNHFLAKKFPMTWLLSSQTVLSSTMLGDFKRNYDCTPYYVYIFKWTINENCSQLLKKKKTVLRRQWQIFPDVSWWSHSQKGMARKLSKHRTNKEKISSHHVKSAHRRAHCHGKFWDKHKDFFVMISHACKASATKWKNSSPHINTTKLTVAAWPHSPQRLPTPSFFWAQSTTLYLMKQDTNQD